jgi:hypothetical protein
LYLYKLVYPQICANSTKKDTVSCRKDTDLCKIQADFCIIVLILAATYLVSNETGNLSNHTFILKDFPFENITEVTVAQHASIGIYFDAASYQYIIPRFLELNQGTFTHEYGNINFPEVTVVQHGNQLMLSCSCNAMPGKLCEHEALVLAAIVKRDDLSIFLTRSSVTKN